MDGLVGFMTFCLLTAASLGGVLLPRRYLIDHHSDETAVVFRSVVSLFIMTTSLVLGLMLNSARGTFEATDRDIHLLSADLILMDRALLQYGDDTADTRARLRSYTERAAKGLHQTDPRSADRTSENLLTAIGTSLAKVQPTNSEHANLLRDITAQYQAIVQLRWTILEQADGSIPKPLLMLVVAWLAFVFASFGYRAPLNGLVVGTLVLSAALMASAIYLLLTLDQPFNGLIQVSSMPLDRALAEMQR